MRNVYITARQALFCTNIAKVYLCRDDPSSVYDRLSDFISLTKHFRTVLGRPFALLYSAAVVHITVSSRARRAQCCAGFIRVFNCFSLVVVVRRREGAAADAVAIAVAVAVLARRFVHIGKTRRARARTHEFLVVSVVRVLYLPVFLAKSTSSARGERNFYAQQQQRRRLQRRATTFLRLSLQRLCFPLILSSPTAMPPSPSPRFFSPSRPF